MHKMGLLERILAVAGVVLVWLPLLAPVLLGVPRSAGNRRFLVDYLMPAELFPMALLGGVLLLWAALRARSRRAPIGWGLLLAVVLLVGSQMLAVATGLASGAAEPIGWPWLLVVASLAGYVLALLVVAVAGLLLVRDAFR